MSEQASWIDLVLARALELRSAGVLSIGIDGCTATFSAYTPPPAAPEREREPVPDLLEPRNALEDPASYADGRVPGFEITKFVVEE